MPILPKNEIQDVLTFEFVLNASLHEMNPLPLDLHEFHFLKTVLVIFHLIVHRLILIFALSVHLISQVSYLMKELHHSNLLVLFLKQKIFFLPQNRLNRYYKKCHQPQEYVLLANECCC